MKKKNKKVLVWSLVIIAILSITAVFLFVDLPGGGKSFLAIGDVPSGCNIGGSGTTNLEFTCPSTCDVNAFSECYDKTGSDQIKNVIFRTNEDRTWFAMDVDGDGILESYTEKYTKNDAWRCDSGVNDRKVIHDGKVYCYGYINGGGHGVFEEGINNPTYKAGTGADVTPSPKEPYASAGLELYEITSDEQSVIARRSEEYTTFRAPKCIAYALDPNANVLTVFKYQTFYNGATPPVNPRDSALGFPSGGNIQEQGGVIYSNIGGHIAYYTEGVCDVPLDISRVTNNEMLQFEIRTDFIQKSYTCSTPWTILDASGSKSSSGIASFNQKSAGQYHTGVKRLNAGETLRFDGSINYAVIDTTSACVIDTCSESGVSYVKCELDNGCPVRGATIQCSEGQICSQFPSGAICGAPFDESLNVDAGFTLNDQIKFRYNLQSDIVDKIFLTFTLRNKNNPSQGNQILGPTSLSLPILDKDLQFNNPGLIGDYEIVVNKNYDGNDVDPTIYEFRIGNPLEMNIKFPYSDTTGTRIIANAPFFVDVGVSENGVLIPDLVQINPTASLRRSDGTQLPITVQAPMIKDGYVRYIFVVGESGKFDFTASASKFGVETLERTTTAEVRLPKIDINYLNINSVQNTKPGDKLIMFETIDSFGENVDVEYEVRIIPSGASTGADDIVVTNLIERTAPGVYQLPYTFSSGSYIIFVKASSPELLVTSELPSASINIDETGVEKECGMSGDCSAGSYCDANGQCVEEDPPILIYVFLIFGGIFLVVLLVIVINLLRKRQKAPVSVVAGL